MADRMGVTWPLMPHTAAKHSILRRYLGAWFPKLAWKRRVIFVDGFAGPGEYSEGEAGSPVVALTTAINHKQPLTDCELIFAFIEKDDERHRHLTQVLGRLQIPAHIKCHAIHGEFAEAIDEVLAPLEEKGYQMAPAFFMIDPFGFSGVPMGLLRRIASHPRTEILVSFMYDSVVRWRKHPDHESTFDALFGCSDWREADNSGTSEERKQMLLGVYTRQLRAIGMEYVRSFEMRDAGNRTEYFLVFATHSIHGLKAMKEAMWNVDRSGSFSFSDTTVTEQLTLFEPEPDFAQLRRLILKRFGGSQADVNEIEEFVVVETSFREIHYKRQVLVPMERSGELEVVSSPRKKAFAYPSGTVIRFLTLASAGN